MPTTLKADAKTAHEREVGVANDLRVVRKVLIAQDELHSNSDRLKDSTHRAYQEDFRSTCTPDTALMVDDHLAVLFYCSYEALQEAGLSCGQDD